MSQPTLTSRPRPGPPTARPSSSVRVAGFHILSINSEGIDVAKWLNAKGVTTFVLKYRLVPTGKDGFLEMAVEEPPEA